MLGGLRAPPPYPRFREGLRPLLRSLKKWIFFKDAEKKTLNSPEIYKKIKMSSKLERTFLSIETFCRKNSQVPETYNKSLLFLLHPNQPLCIGSATYIGYICSR